jgi:IS5 family transposase
MERRRDTQLAWQVVFRNAGNLASLAADGGYE